MGEQDLRIRPSLVTVLRVGHGMVTATKSEAVSLALRQSPYVKRLGLVDRGATRGLAELAKATRESGYAPINS
jgi:hypothetical protein